MLLTNCEISASGAKLRIYKVFLIVFGVSCVLCFLIKRGFGFVTFQDPNSVQKVLNHPGSHVVDKKPVRQCC